MAYLQRVVNGGGHITREFALGRHRVDLLIEFGGNQELIEFKLYRGPASIERGLLQTTEYARQAGLSHATLIVFDRAWAVPGEARGVFEIVERHGVRITLLRLCLWLVPEIPNSFRVAFAGRAWIPYSPGSRPGLLPGAPPGA